MQNIVTLAKLPSLVRLCIDEVVGN